MGRTALLILAATITAWAASAGELIRYRTPGGGVGLTDDAGKIPPGAQILGRSEMMAPMAPLPSDAAPAEIAPHESAAPAATRPAPAPPVPIRDVAPSSWPAAPGPGR